MPLLAALPAGPLPDKIDPPPRGPVVEPNSDLLRLASGRSISGTLPSRKANQGQPGLVPYASHPERALLLHLEFDPTVAWFQRGDLRADQVQRVGTHAPLGPSFPINYTFKGEDHIHYPDVIGRLVDGRPFIAEAGAFEHKLGDQERAKAHAARRLAQLADGEYWIGTEFSLSGIRTLNLISLQSFRVHHDARQLAELEPALRALWAGGRPLSVQAAVATLAGRWADELVQQAAWKVVGDAAADGRLLVAGHLAETLLDTDTELRLLGTDESPLMLTALPSDLPDSPEPATCHSTEASDGTAPVIPGPVIDATQIPYLPRLRNYSAEKKERARRAFERNAQAAEAVLLNGLSYRAAAKATGLDVEHVHYLVKRTRKFGQVAWLPHGFYVGSGPANVSVHPDVRKAIRDLYMLPIRHEAMAIHESPELEDACKEAQVTEPSYWQVYRYCAWLSANDKEVQAARSGLKTVPRGLTALESVIQTIAKPGLVCVVDEHYWDGRFVGPNGKVVHGRMHIAVLLCVATGAILSVVMSLKALTSWDYLRLIKQAMEPKDELVKIYGCENTWNATAKPALILSDRGAIFDNPYVIDVLARRFGVFVERTPPRDPEAKGWIEAVFTWFTRKIAHRLAGTTKGSPVRLGAKYNPVKAAEQAGIRWEVAQELIVQAVVDGYMREWDDLRGGPRWQLWEQAVGRYGVNRYTGSQDTLILLLAKQVLKRNGEPKMHEVLPGNKISYGRRRYVCPGVFDFLVGKQVALYTNPEDARLVYPFYEAQYVGQPAVCPDLVAPVSEDLLRLEHQAELPERQAADEESRQNRRGHLRQAQRGRLRNNDRAERQQSTRQSLAREQENKALETLSPRDRLYLNALAQAADAAPQYDEFGPPVADPDFTPVAAPPSYFVSAPRNPSRRRRAS